MYINDPGHVYTLMPFEEGGEEQTLKFIKKENVDGQFKTVINGTTNEEVLAMLIDRLSYLNNKVRCDFNDNAILHLKSAAQALRDRTADRVRREVEGTPKA